jgi:hypothetical protein
LTIVKNCNIRQKQAEEFQCCLSVALAGKVLIFDPRAPAATVNRIEHDTDSRSKRRSI